MSLVRTRRSCGANGGRVVPIVPLCCCLLRGMAHRHDPNALRELQHGVHQHAHVVLRQLQARRKEGCFDILGGQPGPRDGLNQLTPRRHDQIGFDVAEMNLRMDNDQNKDNKGN